MSDVHVIYESCSSNPFAPGYSTKSQIKLDIGKVNRQVSFKLDEPVTVRTWTLLNYTYKNTPVAILKCFVTNTYVVHQR